MPDERRKGSHHLARLLVGRADDLAIGPVTQPLRYAVAVHRGIKQPTGFPSRGRRMERIPAVKSDFEKSHLEYSKVNPTSKVVTAVVKSHPWVNLQVKIDLWTFGSRFAIFPGSRQRRQRCPPIPNRANPNVRWALRARQCPRACLVPLSWLPGCSSKNPEKVKRTCWGHGKKWGATRHICRQTPI